MISHAPYTAVKQPVALWILFLAGLVPATLAAHSRAEMTHLIDCPTAGVVQKGKYAFNLRLFNAGGVSGQLDAGALRRLTISVAYGGQRILGDQPIDWYPRLEAGVRYRLAEESIAWPALVLGYETWGHGPHDGKHYTIQSKGLFLSASKNYQTPLGQFGIHGGINRARSTDTEDGKVSGWLGADKSINQDLSFLAEIDLARNNAGRERSGWEHVVLNAGVHLALAPQLTLSVFLKDLLTHHHAQHVERELSIRYTEEF